HRMNDDRSLSSKRKAAGRSAIGQHLRPCLGDLPVKYVTAELIDKHLIWPAQAKLSLSYLRQMFGMLLTAFRQALKLGMIDSNPIAGVRFNDFTK
ncbi:hypothetical protein, partial [Klebsiella pneumoniae]